MQRVSIRTRRVILIVVVIQVLVAFGLAAMPLAVRAMPTSMQFQIQNRFPITVGFFRTFGEPTPEDLPAPSVTAGQEISVPELSFNAPAALPSSTPTAPPATTAAPVTAVAGVAATPTTAATALPTATATNTPVPTPTSTPEPLPVRFRLDNLSNVPQAFNNCGPANMTIVLNYHRLEATQTEAAAYLKPNPEDRNVSPWQMQDYVNDFTSLRAIARSGGDLEMVKRLVVAGLPVIVEKGYDPSTTEGWYGHYLTIFGFDDETRRVNAMDTYLGPFDDNGTTETYDVVERYWLHFNYTFLVIYEPAQESTVHSILGQEMLDDRTMWQNAALKAREDIEKDARNAFAWFNLGTSLTRLGEMTGDQSFYQQGAEAFDTARTVGLPFRMLWYQFRPYIAYMKTGRFDDMIALADATLQTSGGRNVEETYFYRGHAYSFKGDINAAIADMRRALELNTNFYPAQIALESLGG